MSHISDHHRSPDTAYTSDLPLEHVSGSDDGTRRDYARRAEAGINGRTFDYLGLALYVPPHVQPIYGMSHLLGEVVSAEVRPGDRVLDLGTGCGVNGILAARRSRRACARRQSRGRAGSPG